MAEPASSNVAPLFNVATIRGRIESTRVHEGNRYTVVTTPAPDAYSHPATLEICSKNQLGTTGSDLTIGVRLGGSVRRFEHTDKVTGEVKKGAEYKCRLFAIED
jgi:hypothetical protein